MAGRTAAEAARGEEEIDMLKNEIRDAEGKLLQTVREIRKRVSFEALKHRALEQVRETAVEKPKQAACTALKTTCAFARKAKGVAARYPLLPIAVGIAILAPLVVAKILRHRRG